MSNSKLVLAAMLFFVAASHLNAADHKIEMIDGAPETGSVPDDVLATLSDQGIRVIRGSSRTVCELWFCKQWETDPGFAATNERMYPFTVGQLIGVLQFTRRGKDFRDQTISKGWYTLRFGLQPTDGNHEGTSPTRDFFIMIGADEDEAGKAWDEEDMQMASAETTGAAHTAILCLQRVTEGSDVVLNYDDLHDWWVLHYVGKSKDGSDVPIDVVVAGHAEE